MSKNPLEGKIDLSSDVLVHSLPDEHVEAIKSLDVPKATQNTIIDWLDDVRGKHKPSTYDDRYYNIMRFVNWAVEHRADPAQFHTRAIQKWLNYLIDKNYAESTKASKYYSVKGWYDHLETLEFIDTNPTEGLKIKDYIDWKAKGKKLQHSRDKIHYLTPEQVKKVIDNVPEPRARNQLVVALMFQIGCRPHEVTTIRYLPNDDDDVDLDDRHVKVYDEKNEDYRTLWYQPNLDGMMYDWINIHRPSLPPASDSEYLFCSHVAPKLDPSRVNKIVKRAADNADIQRVIYTDEHDSNASGLELDEDTKFKRVKYTGHSLRHSYAVQSLKNGMDLKTLSENLGHESLSTTKLYLELLDEDRKNAQLKHGAGADLF